MKENKNTLEQIIIFSIFQHVRHCAQRKQVLMAFADLPITGTDRTILFNLPEGESPASPSKHATQTDWAFACYNSN